jgi:SAM-dependent methyltransferase
VSGDADRLRLRATFEEDADLYDRARPTYPDELIDELPLAAGARIVEIGCGTGQATRLLALRGYDVTCVELGPKLAAVARRNLAEFEQVRVLNASFETWRPVAAEFDAVVAFTSFHWIAPEERYHLAAALLQPGGVLAVVETQHVLAEGGDPFFVAVQEDYIAATDETDESPPPHPDDVGDLSGELVASGLFRDITVRRYLWDLTYTADEYIALLNTYSGHRTWDASMREQLYRLIRRRIAAQAGGTVRKTYLATRTAGTYVGNVL